LRRVDLQNMTTYYVMGASSGSAYTIGEIDGTGTPRIFSGDAIYLYQMAGALWTTRDFGGTWINIIPNLSSGVTTICQTTGSGSSDNTYATEYGSANIKSWYQLFPEITAWSSGSTIPSGSLSDSVSSALSGLPILVGNIAAANAARVWRSTITAPYTMVQSDAGIPVTAQITDLDVAE
jgi:hypothetical protein